VAPWLILLIPPSGAASYTYAPERRGDMIATLTVAVPDGTGPAPVYYALTVEGGPALQVAPPELTDPAGVWKALRSSAWSSTDGRVTWTEFIELDQEKPGVVPLPDVRLEFREAPGAAWQRAEWEDVLKDIRELPLPTPRTASGWGRAGVLWVATAAVAMILLALAAIMRRRRRLEPPLTPDEHALREIHGLERSDATPVRLFVQLSDVLRRYLAERYTLAAPQQTTDELLQAASQVDGLTTEMPLLQEIFVRCDRVKFAGARAWHDDWARTAGQIREFVLRTSRHPPGNDSPGRAKPADQARPRI
jgi:hypothetical protein